MRWIGEAFYGRQAAYQAALAAPGDGPLAATLQRNVFAGAPEPTAAALGLRSMSARRYDGWPRWT